MTIFQSEVQMEIKSHLNGMDGLPANMMKCLAQIVIASMTLSSRNLMTGILVHLPTKYSPQEIQLFMKDHLNSRSIGLGDMLKNGHLPQRGCNDLCKKITQIDYLIAFLNNLRV